MPRFKNQFLVDGTVTQSSHSWDHEDYADHSLNYPVVGIVLSVYPSDHPENRSSIEKDDQRGSQMEADVYIINDGQEGGHIVIPNVVIQPQGPSGIDDFSDAYPRPTTQLTDGGKYDPSLSELDPDKLDGDRCLVQFIGGDFNQPVMTGWMPHPENRKDPSTGAYAEGTLRQGRTLRRRYRGLLATITDEGSLFINTNESGSIVKGSEAGVVRELTDLGGDIQVDMKNNRQLEINFNPPVEDPENQPSLIQRNPPATGEATEERTETDTRFYMDKDFIRAVAGQVIEMSSGSTMHFGTQAGATENLVLGQKFKELLEDLIDAILALQVPTGVGPSGFPINSPTFTALKATVTNEDQLSNWVFTQKDPP